MPEATVPSPGRPGLRGVWRRWFAPAPRPHRVFLQPEAVWHRAPGATETVRLPDWAAWCAAHAGQPVEVVLAGALTTELVAPPALPLQQPDDAAAWARQQWQPYHGDAVHDWPVAAWPQGASALTGLSLQALLAPALAHRVSLLHARPWWSLAWPAVQRSAPEALPGGDGVLWLVEERLVTRLQLQAGALAGLDQRWIDAAVPAALEQLVDEYPADAGSHCVLGYGLDPLACSAEAPLPQRVRPLGRLTGLVPHARWWAR